MIEWSLAQVPNFVGNAYQARALAAAQERDQQDWVAQNAYRQRQEQRQGVADQRDAQALAARQRAAELYKSGDMAGAKQAFLDAGEPLSSVEGLGALKFIETDTAIYGLDPSGKVVMEQTIPQKAPTAPIGYAWGPDGKSLSAIPGGPGDPKVIGGNAYTKRRVEVENPLPSRARSGGGASTGVPSGFVLD